MSKHLLVLFALLVCCGIWSCTDNTKKNDKVEVVPQTTKVEKTKPHCRILIQPYDGFSQERATEVAKQLKNTLNKYVTGLDVTDIRVLPNKQLTPNLMNDAKTRYRASKILDWQYGLLQQPEDAVVGLTDNDISTSAHGYKDWGILGLSYLKENNCVISTFRVKDKTQFWKVVLHEFGHAFLGLDHCPNNDRTCFMVDCNGKPDLAKEKYLCETCSNSIHL